VEESEGGAAAAAAVGVVVVGAGGAGVFSVMFFRACDVWYVSVFWGCLWIGGCGKGTD